eukprot:3195401-Prymnesium_polylepis.1
MPTISTGRASQASAAAGTQMAMARSKKSDQRKASMPHSMPREMGGISVPSIWCLSSTSRTRRATAASVNDANETRALHAMVRRSTVYAVIRLCCP